MFIPGSIVPFILFTGEFKRDNSIIFHKDLFIIIFYATPIYKYCKSESEL